MSERYEKPEYCLKTSVTIQVLRDAVMGGGCPISR